MINLRKIAGIIVPVLLALNSIAQKDIGNLYYSGRIDAADAGSSLTVLFWQHYVIGPSKNGAYEIEVPVSDSGTFQVTIPNTKRFGRVSIIRIGPKPYTYSACRLALTEPGDSIFIHANLGDKENPSFAFSGKGAEKYNFYRPINNTGSATVNEQITVSDSTSSSRIKALQKLQSKLGDSTFRIIKTDIVTEELTKVCKVIEGKLIYSPSATDSVKEFIKKSIPALKMREPREHNLILQQSASYTDYLYFLNKNKLLLASKDNHISFKQFYNRIKLEYKGNIRDKLLTYLLSNNLERYVYFAYVDPTEMFDCLKDATTTVKNKDYLNILMPAFISGTKGQKALDFNLPDTSGKYIRLSDFKGKVVLIDLYGPGCGACIDFKHNFEEYIYPNLKNRQDLQVVSISVHQDKSRWIKEIPLYSNWQNINLYTEGKMNKHPYTDYYQINSVPRIMIIDRKGNIVTAAAPNNNKEKVLEMLNEALGPEESASR